MNVKVGDIIKLENNQFVAVSISYCLKNLSQVKIVYVLNCLHLQIQQICNNLSSLRREYQEAFLKCLNFKILLRTY